jgi:hypothetical protein
MKALPLEHSLEAIEAPLVFRCTVTAIAGAVTRLNPEGSPRWPL